MKLRFCSKCGWRYVRAVEQRYCKECHAENTRLTRKPLSGIERKLANARAYLQVYVSRGFVKKRPCLICGREKVRAYQAEYKRPLHVVWLCEVHFQMVASNNFSIMPIYVIDGRMLIGAVEVAANRIKLGPASHGYAQNVRKLENADD